MIGLISALGAMSNSTTGKSNLLHSHSSGVFVVLHFGRKAFVDSHRRFLAPPPFAFCFFFSFLSVEEEEDGHNVASLGIYLTSCRIMCTLLGHHPVFLFFGVTNRPYSSTIHAVLYATLQY